MSARSAARLASRAALQALEGAMQGMRDSAEEYNRAAEAGEDAEPADRRFHDFDLQFHEALATASGNRVVAFLFEAMSKSLRESFSMSRRGQTLRGSTREDTVAAHQAVLDAIRAGKQAAAAEAMRLHLTDTANDIRFHVSNSREQ
jgi:GntR family transcriptional repressor for pyruvate dehydrogenase complex